MAKIEFVEYTGEWPNLCRGVLTLKLDDELVKFGYDCYNLEEYHAQKKELNRFPSFWSSGGCAGVDSDGSSYCSNGEWLLYESELPEKFKDLGEELIDIFNANVPWGCCGGCI